MLDVVGSLDSVGAKTSYTVTLQQGVTYFIEVDGDSYGNETSPMTLDDPVVQLLDDSRTQVASNDDVLLGVDQDARIVYVPQETGDFTIKVSGFTNKLLGSYRLIVAEDDYRGTIAGAGPEGQLAQGGTIAGSLDYPGSGGMTGDVDLFAIFMLPGLTYRVDLKAAASGHGTLIAPKLDLLSVQNNVEMTRSSDADGRDLHFTFQSHSVFVSHPLRVSDATLGAGGTFQLFLSAGMATDGDDSVTGSIFNDAVMGLAGDDHLVLGDGNDMLSGGDGLDKLHGGYGNDTLMGDHGRDQLYGAQGDDTFVFLALQDSRVGGTDAIVQGRLNVSFDGAGQAQGDVIDLSAVDGDATASGQQHLIFDGTRGVGHVWTVEVDGKTVVMAETGALDGIDFRLFIRDGNVLASTYDAGDFLL